MGVLDIRSSPTQRRLKWMVPKLKSILDCNNDSLLQCVALKVLYLNLIVNGIYLLSIKMHKEEKEWGEKNLSSLRSMFIGT